MRNFRDLKVYQESRILAKQVFLYTKDFPKDERYGLTSQIRRASVSIVSNIAEGSARSSKKDFSHFLNISLGSSFELEAQIELSCDFDYLSMSHAAILKASLYPVQKMLGSLIKSLL